MGPSGLEGFAQASIMSETFGNIRVQAQAWGFGGASAYAQASYDEWMDYGTSPGIVTGVYSLPNIGGIGYTVTQGHDAQYCQSCGRGFALVSTYDGTPIEVAASVTAAVVDRNFESYGLFLQSLTFTADVPEPGTFWLVGLAGLMIVAGRMRKKG
jgi:hypothetical protein